MQKTKATIITGVISDSNCWNIAYVNLQNVTSGTPVIINRLKKTMPKDARTAAIKVM
jgi:hypothetical protein